MAHSPTIFSRNMYTVSMLVCVCLAAMVKKSFQIKIQKSHVYNKAKSLSHKQRGMSIGTRRDKHQFCTARGCEGQGDGHLRTWPTWALRHNTWMRGDQKEKVMALGMGGWLGVHLWVLDRLGETGVLFGTFPGHCQQGASRGHR